MSDRRDSRSTHKTLQVSTPKPKHKDPGKAQKYQTNRSNLVNPEDSTHHAQDDDLQLYVLGRLSAADVDVLERHVFDCEECKGRLRVTAQIVAKILNLRHAGESTNRRAELRFHISDAVFLRSFSPLLPSRWPVQIIDVSKNGLGLLVPTHFAPGSLVQVQSGATFALGEVRFSRQISEYQFHTGIRLQDVAAVPHDSG